MPPGVGESGEGTRRVMMATTRRRMGGGERRGAAGWGDLLHRSG